MTTDEGDVVPAVTTSWRDEAYAHWELITMLLILGAGVTLRSVGLDWGMPYVFHPDEWRVIDLERFSSQAIGVGSDYGTLPIYVLRVLTRVVSFFVSGYSPAKPESLLQTVLIGRFLSMAYDMGTITVVYFIGKRVFDARVGVLASALLAFAPLHLQQSHIATVDASLGFFVALSVYFLYVSYEKQTKTSHLVAAASIGAAIATKFSAIFLLPMLAFSFYWASRQNQKGVKGRNPYSLRTLLLSFAVTMIVFLALTPQAFLHFRSYWGIDFSNPRWWYAWSFPGGTNKLLWNILMTRGVVKPLWALSSTSSMPYLHLFSNILMHGLGFVTTIAASLWMLHTLVWNRSARALWFLALIALGLLFVGGSRPFFTRYAIVFGAAFALVAAKMISSCCDGRTPTAKGRIVRRIVFAISLLVAITQGVGYSRVFSVRDSRLQAAKWIDENIPKGSTIAWELARFWSPYCWDQPDPRYRIRRWDLYNLYDSRTTHVHLSGILRTIAGPWMIPPRNHGNLTDDELRRALSSPLRDADYVVISNRFLDQYRSDRRRFRIENRHYDRLFDGKLGFTLVKTFKVVPWFFGVAFDDTEHMLRSTHPTIWIFKRR